MGYTNPQRIIDRSFDAFTNAGKRWVGQIVKTREQIQERNALEKKQQKIQWEKQNEEQQKMYSSVNEMGSTGNSILDENYRSFYNADVDKYFEITNLRDNGKIKQADANRELANLRNDVLLMNKIIPYIAEQASMQKEHGKIPLGTAGAISSVTSGESQDVLGQMIIGGNTAMVRKNGIMYLYNPPIAGQQEGAMINLNEIAAMQASGEDIIHLVPDISKDLEMAYNNIYNPDQVNSEYIKLKTVELDDGNTYSYKEFKTERFNPDPPPGKWEPFDAKEYGIQAMIDGGQFDPLIRDKKKMESIWQDIMPDNITGDISWGFVDPELDGDEVAQEEFLADQVMEAKKWMAQQAYDNNSDMDNVLKYISKTKTKTKDNKNDNSNSNTRSKPKSYTTVAQYNAAVENGEIEKFDTIIIGGKIVKGFVQDPNLKMDKNLKYKIKK